MVGACADVCGTTLSLPQPGGAERPAGDGGCASLIQRLLRLGVADAEVGLHSHGPDGCN